MNITDWNLPAISDKPRRAHQTPIAEAARESFVQSLQSIGDTPRDVADAVVAGWENSSEVRALKFPHNDILYANRDRRVDLTERLILDVLADESGSFWRCPEDRTDVGRFVYSEYKRRSQIRVHQAQMAYFKNL